SRRSKSTTTSTASTPTSTSRRACSSSSPQPSLAGRHPRLFPESDPMQVVIGVDPGAANLGFGFVRVEGNRMSALDAGVVETSAELPIERRLEHIHAELAKLIEWHEPTALAI